ncbi:MAG: hypothetical protein GY796_19725, partial [Chloroflexi bacterium]|nr:hypothetical protein [Chloroflexota bacterium]
KAKKSKKRPSTKTSRPSPTRNMPRTRVARPAPKPRSTTANQPAGGYIEDLQYEPIMAKPAQTPKPAPVPKTQNDSRLNRRPPRPSAPPRQSAIKGVQARPRSRH